MTTLSVWCDSVRFTDWVSSDVQSLFYLRVLLRNEQMIFLINLTNTWIMTWKSSNTIPIPSLSLCSPIQFLSNVTLIHFHCLCNPAGRAQRAVSLRSERSMSRGFPSLELDTVLEERSDPEQTQVRKKERSFTIFWWWHGIHYSILVNLTSSYLLVSCLPFVLPFVRVRVCVLLTPTVSSLPSSVNYCRLDRFNDTRFPTAAQRWWAGWHRKWQLAENGHFTDIGLHLLLLVGDGAQTHQKLAQVHQFSRCHPNDKRWWWWWWCG